MHLLKNAFWPLMSIVLISHIVVGTPLGRNLLDEDPFTLRTQYDTNENTFPINLPSDDTNGNNNHMISNSTQYNKQQQNNYITLDTARQLLQLDKEFFRDLDLPHSPHVSRKMGRSIIEQQLPLLWGGKENSNDSKEIEDEKRAAKVRKQRFFSWGGKRNEGGRGFLARMTKKNIYY